MDDMELSHSCTVSSILLDYLRFEIQKSSSVRKSLKERNLSQQRVIKLVQIQYSL